MPINRLYTDYRSAAFLLDVIFESLEYWRKLDLQLDGHRRLHSRLRVWIPGQNRSWSWKHWARIRHLSQNKMKLDRRLWKKQLFTGTYVWELKCIVYLHRKILLLNIQFAERFFSIITWATLLHKLLFLFFWQAQRQRKALWQV